MKTFSLLTIGLLSAAVAADHPIGRHRQRKHPGGECMQLLHAEHLVQTSKNATLMARLQSNYPERAEIIKKHTSQAQSRITEIEGNSKHPADWLANCHAVGAHLQLKHQCMDKEFLPKKQAKWNDASNAAEIKQRHNWTEEQFSKEKELLNARVKALNDNHTLTELCVQLPKSHKGGKDGKDGKHDGKDAKGAKGPDGKAASSQKKSAASGLDGTEAVRGGAFALAVTLLMAITIL